MGTPPANQPPPPDPPPSEPSTWSAPAPAPYRPPPPKAQPLHGPSPSQAPPPFRPPPPVAPPPFLPPAPSPRQPELTAQLLRALADLAPGGGDRLNQLLDVTTGRRSILWLGHRARYAEALIHPEDQHRHRPDAPVLRHLTEQGLDLEVSDTAAMRRLLAADALHSEERLLHLGWVWLVGRLPTDGERTSTKVMHPLISVPVHVQSHRDGRSSILNAGDGALTPLVPVGGRALHLELERLVQFGEGREVRPQLIGGFPRLTGWISDVVAAMGLGEVPVVVDRTPAQYANADTLVAVVGEALYLARTVESTDVGTGLRNWAAQPRINTTAFASILAPEVAMATAARPVQAPEPPMVLTAAQRDAVHRARDEAVVVVSGPPGSGKSHAVVAQALDASAAGRSVLVATQTIHAAEVLSERLRALPGPEPVVFGGDGWRQEVRGQIEDGLDLEAERRLLARLAKEVDDAAARADWVHAALREVLVTEQQAAGLDDAGNLDSLLQLAAPAAFDGNCDLDVAWDQYLSAAGPGGGWWANRRVRRADARLRDQLGSRRDVPLDRLRDALELARARRAAAGLAARGGTHIGAAWAELEAAELAHRQAVGVWLTERARREGARSPGARRAAQQLAVALRAGRAARRSMLADLDADALLAALPLWVGTLRDIDDLLPARAAMFDLVILDEASQIDLPRAAAALLRAERAVVVGDPRQLRHVSFVADADTNEVAARHGLVGDLAARVDVRRVSAFDAATAVAAPVWLGEHFRSVPHLIGFSAERFYPQPVQVATRHPANEAIDAIEVRRVPGTRDDDGVNAAEVDAVRQVVEELIEAGWTSIGVLSPMRAQADAIESMLLESFTLEQIRDAGLRTGTVHAFQGNERDVVVASLVLDDASPAASRRFVEDPNLLNVMVTRARQHMVVMTSLSDPPPGLLADYLSHAANPPVPQRTTTSTDDWISALAEELERGGLACRAGYPVGRWTVDLVVGEGADAVGLECRVHPDGPGAHIERHQSLRRAGWTLVEAWPSRFDGDAARAAVLLAGELSLTQR